MHENRKRELEGVRRVWGDDVASIRAAQQRERDERRELEERLSRSVSWFDLFVTLQDFGVRFREPRLVGRQMSYRAQLEAPSVAFLIIDNGKQDPILVPFAKQMAFFSLIDRGLQVGFRPDFTKNIAFGLSLPDGRFNDGEVDGWERPLPVDKWHQIHEANCQVYISYDMARAGRVYREVQQTPTNAQV